MSLTLPALLERSVERHGDKPAFRFDGVDLGYEQLLRRSNQLANTLRADGVQPGQLVGVMMGKALENAVAVYGIMAAGAAYVPLDPASPVARLEAIANSCDLSHFVIDGERAKRAAKLCRNLDRRCFVYGVSELDDQSTSVRDWSAVAQQPTRAPRRRPGPDDLAYLIFTSGSTGAPKGIMHSHRSAGAYATMAAELYELRSEDRLSNFPPLHFDQSTFDFFSGPLVGATTVIIGKEHQLVPASLSQLIERERLSVWYSVPLALVQLLLYGVLDERDCSSLRWVVYGGEPFPLKHLRGLMKRWPQARFSNCYGPAETNQCTYHHVETADVDGDRGIPIGAACPGMTTMVVDSDDRPVPDGVEGELLVNSPTTMVGYWDRADLNAAVFHEDRTGAETRRFYRTGDMARVDDRGLLEFVGRRDRQIKVRGMRVELDEVEAVLGGHPAVEEVAVVAGPSEDDDRTLVAFASVRPGHDLDRRGLQRHGSAQLARHAVPTLLHIVDSFPRTTSGKVDYLALATLIDARQDAERE